MKLFFGKKEEKPRCCCNESNKTFETNTCCGGNGCTINSIKILGAGCKSCHLQYENMKKAVESMNINVEVEYITDMEKVMSYGVMSMPAIVVNENVVSMGKVLSSQDIISLLDKLGCK